MNHHSSSEKKGGPDFKRRIKGILSGPDDPGKEFLLSGATYGQVYAMAAQLKEAVGRPKATDPAICICTDNRAIVTAALLAAIAGGFSLVLPYAANPQVLADLQQVTGFRQAVTDIPENLPHGVRPLVPESSDHPWPPEGTAKPVDPDAQWVHLFTGGSTGTPRIWSKTVRNLMAETFYLQQKYDFSPEDRVVATVGTYHIYGLLYSLLVPLAASGAVAPGTPSFPAEIEAVVRQNAATVLISVPAHYRALNGFTWSPDSLRLAFSSAGMLARKDNEAFTRQTGVPVVEIYGSTETGGIAARNRASGEEDFTPFDTVDLKIEQEAILVRSDHLAPDLTDHGRRYFRMADRATGRRDGRFSLLGRSDGIVKVGGKRVDLEAVRQVLKRHAQVAEAQVIALPVGRARENQIVAVVEGCPDASELDDLLQASLEPYARPRRVKIVDKIPVTTAGKYDRKTIEELFNPAAGHCKAGMERDSS